MNERLHPISVPSRAPHQTGGTRSCSESRFLLSRAKQDHGIEGGGGGDEGSGGGKGGGRGDGDMGGNRYTPFLLAAQMVGYLGLRHLLFGKMQRQCRPEGSMVYVFLQASFFSLLDRLILFRRSDAVRLSLQ